MGLVSLQTHVYTNDRSIKNVIIRIFCSLLAFENTDLVFGGTIHEVETGANVCSILMLSDKL